MTTKELRKLEVAAIRKRKALAVLERAFGRWSRSKRQAKRFAQARALELDAWIKTLGEARWEHARAVADLAEARRKP